MKYPYTLVVCLCAKWCGTCRGYRDVFMAVAEEFPGVQFSWVDIEETHVADDLDIEDFPTLLIYAPGQVRFYGVVMPQEGHLRRLLRSLGDETLVSIEKHVDIVKLLQLSEYLLASTPVGS